MKHAVVVELDVFDEEDITQQLINDLGLALSLFGVVYNVPDMDVRVTVDIEVEEKENDSNSTYS